MGGKKTQKTQALTKWCALTSPQFIIVIHAAALRGRRLHGGEHTWEHWFSPFIVPVLGWWWWWCWWGGGRLTLLRKVRSVVFGRTIAGRIVVSVLSLHEQRTGWSSRHRASVEGRRAVYNNNTVPMTSCDWQPPQPLAEVFSHQQHAIFGKWLHHWGSTAAYGRRDFRRDFQFVVQNRDNEFVGSISSQMSQLFRDIQNFKMVSVSNGVS